MTGVIWHWSWQVYNVNYVSDRNKDRAEKLHIHLWVVHLLQVKFITWKDFPRTSDSRKPTVEPADVEPN